MLAHFNTWYTNNIRKNKPDPEKNYLGASIFFFKLVAQMALEIWWLILIGPG